MSRLCDLETWHLQPPAERRPLPAHDSDLLRNSAGEKTPRQSLAARSRGAIGHWKSYWHRTRFVDLVPAQTRKLNGRIPLPLIPTRNDCFGSEELKTVILRLIGLNHIERKEPPSKKAPIKPPTRQKKPPTKEPPDPPNPGRRRRDNQAPIGDPPPKRGPKRVAYGYQLLGLNAVLT